MKVARTPLEGARAEEARWAGLLPGEEPGRGRRRQVEEVEGEEAAGARRARGEEAAAGPDVAVAPAVRPSRPLGTAAQRHAHRHPKLRGARVGRNQSTRSFEMPGSEGHKSYEPNPAYVKQ